MSYRAASHPLIFQSIIIAFELTIDDHSATLTSPQSLLPLFSDSSGMKRYHVRRSDKEITDPATLKTILRSAQFVTIAMSVDDRPYLVSLSHGYDEDYNCVYFHCANEGKKVDYLRANNAVWGQAILDGGYAQNECTHHYASVHFSGRVVFLEDPAEKRRALECMMRQLDKSPERLMERLDTEDFGRALAERTLVGRIDIEYMSGKKSKEVEI